MFVESQSDTQISNFKPALCSCKHDVAGDDVKWIITIVLPESSSTYSTLLLILYYFYTTTSEPYPNY